MPRHPSLTTEIELLKQNQETTVNNFEKAQSETNGILERIDGRLDSIDKTLVAQQKSLDEHIRRTEILEKEVVPLKEQSTQIKILIRVGAVLVTAGGLGGAGLGLEKLLGAILGADH